MQPNLSIVPPHEQCEICFQLPCMKRQATNQAAVPSGGDLRPIVVTSSVPSASPRRLRAERTGDEVRKVCLALNYSNHDPCGVQFLRIFCNTGSECNGR